MTVRKIGKRARARRSLLPLYELGAYNVLGFCLAHGLSRRMFYVMRRAGDGPRIMKCGRRTLISIEAAQAWRRARERAARRGRYGARMRARCGRRAAR
jgi:hypothetical protein